MVDHAKRLRVQCNGTRLALGTDAFRPLWVTARAVMLDSVVWLDKGWNVGGPEFWSIRGRVDLSQVRVEGRILDLLVGKVTWVEWI